MSSAGGSQARYRWLDPGKGFPDEVLPRKRQLASALRALCCLLRSEDPGKSGSRPLKQAEAAKRLGCTADMLSRYLNSPRIPSQDFVERLYKEACADAAASGQDVGITSEELLVLRARALGEQAGCEHCQELGRRIDSLTEQLNAPCPACAAHERDQEVRRRQRKRAAAQLRSARKEAAGLRAMLADMKVELAEKLAAEAGLREGPAAKAAGALLPVPRRTRDRQQNTKEVLAARRLVAQAEELDSSGREDLAFTLLRQSTTEVLTPAETALVMVELRHREQDRLADGLVHAYGRDQENRDVMAVALELHENGATDDAGAMLRAALG
ncbi:helix-turn-helix transcriptional regulator [Streptomyces sp. NPDC004232]|uniref:helix-turn-helix domain-containing protein n=1 Tax=Streptomyces sp. NPDC004232 TaxID=3154454 RepID=UPI0033ACE3EC